MTPPASSPPPAPSTTRFRPVALGLAALVLAASFAAAGHGPAPVASYTGCLSNGGQLTKLAEGDSPTGPCTGGATEVHLSAGDLTGLAAGVGLEGGGDAGDVALGLAPGYRLPQGCSPAEIPKISRFGRWICETDRDTLYAAGDGLALDGSTFDVDWTKVHRRTDSSCAAGQLVRGVHDGAIACAPDADTHYSGGPGVTLTGTSFAADPSYVQRRVSASCEPGSAIRAIAEDGTVECESAATGLRDLQWVTIDYTNSDALGTFSSYRESCPDGKRVIFGGGEMLTPEGTSTSMLLTESHPRSPTSWEVEWRKDTAASVDVRIHLLCVRD